MIRLPISAAAALLLTILTASPGAACVKRLRGVIPENGVFFTGTATADTLHAGPGTVEFDRSGRSRPIYGQLTRVDRIDGPAAAQLPAGTDEVVVVTWGTTHPVVLIPSRNDLDRGPGILQLAPATGYVITGKTLERAPDGYEEAQTEKYSRVYFHVLAEPDAAPDGVTRWRGAISATLLTRLVPESPFIDDVVASVDERASERFRRDLPAETSAVFTRDEDGRVRVRESIAAPDGRVLVLEGERISREVLRNR